ncbi:MAG: M48 family metallopeptidase [Candidatus Methanofastidiosia archaeon]
MIDDERQKLAKKYFSFIFRASMLNNFLLFLVLSFLTILNPFPNLEWKFLEIPTYFVLIFSTATILSFPLSLWGFKIEKRFGFSTQSFGDFLKDYLKSFGLTILISTPIISLIYLSMTKTTLWWIYAGALAFLVIVLLSNLSPILITPLFYKQKPLEDEKLKRRLLSLVKKASFKIKDVYVIDFSKKTRKSNAYITGIRGTRRIVLADNLLQNFEEEEILSTFAHELGHHINRDIPRYIFLGGFIYLSGFYLSDVLLNASKKFLKVSEISDPKTLPFFLLLMMSFLFLTQTFMNSYSRRREFLADEYSLNLIKNPKAFESLNEKFANLDLYDAYPNRFVKILFYNHPPIGERIEHARCWKKPDEVRNK